MGFTVMAMQGLLSFDDALHIVQEQQIVYGPDTTMQAMLPTDMDGCFL